MTVAELIAALQQAPPDALVLCTWEGIEPEIAAIYIDHKGQVLIDSDDAMYQRRKADPAQPQLWPPIDQGRKEG